MPGKMAVIFGVSNILWMVLAASQAFKIEVVPESQITAQINASISLTCRTTGCAAPAFSWRTQIDSPLNGQVRREGDTSVLTMDPVSFGNEHSYLCTATCGARKEERAVEVLVYSFPRDPEIQLSGPLEVGKPVTATCLVRDVYPFERLEMDLLKGDQLLKNQEFLEPAETKSLETKGVEVTFTPTNEDIGEALVCRAQLHIQEIDAELRKRETRKVLQVHISPRNTVVSVSPSTRLQEGGSVTMTCSSEGLPAPQITWSRMSDDGQPQPLSGNGTLTLVAMRVEDSGIYVCEGVNPVGRDRKEVELVVQEKPFTVEISPGPQVAARIGDSVVLTCGATGCAAPSFSWRTQIDSPLNGQARQAGAASQLTLSPVSFEHERSYLCTVTCGRRKQEKTIKVDLYSFPRDPEIEMSGGLVDGEPATVRCRVPDVHPLGRLQIQLLKGERLLETKNFWEAEEKDSLGTGSVEVTFTPTTDDTGRALVCRAELEMDEVEFEPKQRQSTQTLRVQIAPRNMTVSVSPSSTLREGQSVNLTCSGDGLPAPKIRWSWRLPDGSLQFLSESTTLTLTSARRADSGTYVCEGSNPAGTSRKEVELIVQVPSQDMQLLASPSERVQEGDTVTIYCTCGNYPKTWIILKKKAETGDTVLQAVGGAYVIHKAQLEDAGVYECESKSELGRQFRSITLDVKGRERDYFSPGFLMLYCASSLLIPAIGTIVYFARRANMRGSYSLVDAQKSKV